MLGVRDGALDPMLGGWQYLTMRGKEIYICPPAWIVSDQQPPPGVVCTRVTDTPTALPFVTLTQPLLEFELTVFDVRRG